MRRFVDLKGVEFKRANADGDLIVSMALSSEEPVERWFGTEILDHAQESVQLDRMNNGAPLLFNHNWDDLRGTHEPGTVRVDKDRVMRADLRITTATDQGRDAAKLVETRVLTKASIGYRIYKVIEQTKKRAHGVEELVTREIPGDVFEGLVERFEGQSNRPNKRAFYRELDAVCGSFQRGDDEQPTYRVMLWGPFESSLVTVPADDSVGLGRMAQQSVVGNPPASQSAATTATTRKETSTMKDDATLAAEAEAAEKQKQEQQERAALAGYDAARAEKQRAEAIRKMAKNMDLNDERAIQAWIVSGKDWNTIGDEMCKVKEERSKQAAISVASIGLTEHEAKRFSVVRAINAIINKDWTKAGFEADVSRATAQRVGKYMNEHTFAIPAEVQNLHARVLISGTAAQGGNLVQTDLVSFIDVLRNRSVAFQAGVTVMGGLVGQVAIPKKSTAGTFAWAAETGTATAAELVLAQVTMSPKKLHGYQEYSKQLMIQSTPDVEMLVLSDLAAGLAVEVDRSILLGSGANNPTGIRFTSGLGTANPTAGTAVVYSDMIRFQSTVAAANAMFPNFTYVTTPAVAAILMAKSRFTNSDTPIWEAGILDGRVVGMRAMATQQMTSAVMLAGDFSQAIFGQWSGMEIEVNPYANFQADIVGVKATIYADVAVRYPGAFAVGTGMTG